MVQVNFKKPFIAFLAIVVVFFGYWVVFNVKDSFLKQENVKEKDPLSYQSKDFLNKGKSDSLRWIENLENKDLSKDLSKAEANGSNVNLTELLSQNVASEFISKVDLSKSSSQNITKQIEKLSADDLNSINFNRIFGENPLGFLNEISDSDLKIIKDSSSLTIKKYFQDYSNILSKIGGGMINNPDDLGRILSQSLQNQDQLKLSQITSDLDNSFNQLKVIETPESILNFHKKNLIFLQNLSVLFKAIKDIEIDPIKTYLAYQDGFYRVDKMLREINNLYKEIKSQYGI